MFKEPGLLGLLMPLAGRILDNSIALSADPACRNDGGSGLDGGRQGKPDGAAPSPRQEPQRRTAGGEYGEKKRTGGSGPPPAPTSSR